MKVAYVRVSTEEQNEARQIEALKKHSIEKWFTEKISGKSMNRPQLQAMLDLSLIHISEPTRRTPISYAVFCLKKKKKRYKKKKKKCKKKKKKIM